MKKLLSLGFIFFLLPLKANAADEKILLDVRTQEEWNEKHLTDSVIDFKKPDFKEQLGKLDKSKNYQLFCRSGNRSGQAVTMMKEMGFKKVESVGSLEDAMKVTGKPCVGPACPK
ncbi:MAG: rhodanese-like domain-containing protein [Proteobacteria bacterium]|nr:MAG: rhodanese-like domain-containing protein [Pseudomonadota bacterium]